ncbi:MAG TPA: EAL domain-containing response regulator [Terracidiphilus sp.]|nr:EAL domain-containing response regulator [Terracidiphilus sp.]
MTSSDRIVVIDDDEVILKIVSAAAETMQLECVATGNVDLLPELLTPATSLILLDLMMPKMDGVEVLRMLGERRCKAGIVLMSGIDKRVIETAKKMARSLGLTVAGHLQKPFSLPQLQMLLETHKVLEPEEDPVVDEREPIPDHEVIQALELGQIVNYYQPQINLATGEVSGVEALARWRHPERGLLYPEHFLERMEVLGLMDRLCWVTVDLGLAEVGQFADQDGRVPRLSLNVSVTSLRDLKFPDIFLDLAHKHGVPAKNIAVEITETGLVTELALTLDVLTRLRMRQIQLSIDDFGTGYAMMQQLQNVPAIELKIDKSFVQWMESNMSDRVMVEKIIEMGHELEMEVVAEGVETQEQYDLLRKKGCDSVQGFLVSHALPPEEMVRWLAEYRGRAKL